ncbi:excinuclease ABC subunit B [compost metagenome]
MTVNIHMDNISSYFENLPLRISHEISKELSYEQTNFFSSNINVVKMFERGKNITYTGLVPRAIKILKEFNIKYKIYDNRQNYETNATFPLLPEFQLRDYQEEIVTRSTSREIIQAATGAGKTFIMYNLIRKFSVKPVIVIAPKVSLAEQIKEEFERFSGSEIGLFTGSIKEIKDITICTPGSATEELLQSAKAIFFDECHNVPSNTIFECAKKAINAFYRIGVSATPWRDSGDDIVIEAALSIRKPHLSINASKLIEKGKLVPCNIYFVPFEQSYEWQGSYEKTYDIAIAFNEQRNNLISKLAHKASFLNNRTTLILVKKIKQGELIEKEIKLLIENNETVTYNDIEISRIEFLSGKDSAAKREAVFESIKNGFTKILIGSTIADEGLNLPILDCLILAGGGKSSTKSFQRVGRVLRLYQHKKNAIVFDFMDNTPTFMRHSLTRKSLYQTEPLWKINYL